jgi:hypothetical protein
MHNSLATAPASKRDLVAAFAAGVETFKRTSLSLDVRETLEGEFCTTTAVFKPNGDIIFQLFPVDLKQLGGDEKGRALLSELVEVYFSVTDRFSADWVPELKSWALKAGGLANALSYDKTHHVDGFATYVNQALADLKGMAS